MPQDFVDLSTGLPSVAPQGIVRLARGSFGLMTSTDGQPFAPLAPPISLETAGVVSINGIPIPGLRAWYKADAGVTYAAWPVLAGWADQSGNGLNLTPIASPSIVAGAAGIGLKQAVLMIPGSGSYMNSATSFNQADREPRTIFTVCKSLDTSGGYLLSTRQAAGAGLFALRNSAGTVFNFLGGSGANATLINQPIVAGQPMIVEHSYDGRQANTGVDATVRTRINGVEQAVASGGMAIAETGTAGSQVGSWTADPGNGFNGPIAEQLYFNRKLTPGECRLVNGYLSGKYSIAIAPEYPPYQTMLFGDSHALGVGDPSTIAAGGMRKELNTLHGGLLLNVGSFYSPHSVFGVNPTNQEGFYNRCEGNAGFTSGAAPAIASGIGGSYLITTLTSTPADIIILMIGCNDPVVLGTTVGSAANTGLAVRAIVDTIYAMLPLCKVVVFRATQLATFQGGAGTNNPIIVAQGPAISAALGPNGPGGQAPNVMVSPLPVAAGSGLAINNIAIPPVVADTLYANGGTDGTHISVAGWHQILIQSFHPFLVSLGL